jgi:hypothetical protein
MADLCPECSTFTVEAIGVTNAVKPPAPLKRCSSCGVEVIDIRGDEVVLGDLIELRPPAGADHEGEGSR